MNLWLILSLLFSFLQAVMIIMSKYAMSNMDPTSLMTYLLVIQVVIVVFYNWMKGYKMYFDKYSILGGVSFGIANLGLMTGIDKAPNAGLADALMRLQVILTTIFSVVFLKQKLTIKGVSGMVLAVMGAIMITYTKSDKKDDKKDDKKGKDDSIPWYVYPLVGGALLSIKDISGVLAVNKGMSPQNFVFSVAFFSCISLLIYNYTITHSFMPKFKDDKKRNQTMLEIFIASAASTIGAYAITTAMPMAPNAGYSKAISLFSVVLTTLYSITEFNEKLSTQKLSGIATLLIGAVIVSLSG